MAAIGTCSRSAKDKTPRSSAAEPSIAACRDRKSGELSLFYSCCLPGALTIMVPLSAFMVIGQFPPIPTNFDDFRSSSQLTLTNEKK